jgi:hypothetical protein
MGLGVTNPSGNRGTPVTSVQPRTNPPPPSSSGGQKSGCEAIREVNPDPACFGGGGSGKTGQQPQPLGSTSTQVTNPTPSYAPDYVSAVQAIADMIAGLADQVDDDPPPMPQPPQRQTAASQPPDYSADPTAAPPPADLPFPLTPKQLGSEISGAIATLVAQYYDLSPEFEADIKEAVDTFKDLQLDSIKRGEADALTTTQNLVAATHVGITGATIDAAVPKNGDPINDSMNDFRHTLARMFQTEPGAPGVVDRIKGAFSDLTGNAKRNLECIEQMLQEKPCQ